MPLVNMKKRAANFTPEEKSELLDAVLRHRNILFGRVGLPSRYWIAKKAAWCDIVDAVNRVRPSPGRNVHECRRKLKDLKAATRKKFMDVNGAWKADVDIKDATQEELKILKLLGTDDKLDEDAEMDLSIVKIEPTSDAEQTEEESVAGQESQSQGSPTDQKATSPAGPSHQAATLKVEPVKRPVGQVLPLSTQATTQGQSQSQSAGSASATAAVPPTQGATSPGVAPSLSQPLSVIGTAAQRASEATVTTATGSLAPISVANVGPSHAHGHDHRRGHRSYLHSLHSSNSAHHAMSASGGTNGLRRPLAEFSSPMPLKRIKLFVRNANAPSAMTPSSMPARNMVSYTTCPCERKKIFHDRYAQTETDCNRAMMAKIVETQEMTARALTNLEVIARNVNVQTNNCNVAKRDKKSDDLKRNIKKFIHEMYRKNRLVGERDERVEDAAKNGDQVEVVGVAGEEEPAMVEAKELEPMELDEVGREVPKGDEQDDQEDTSVVIADKTKLLELFDHNGNVFNKDETESEDGQDEDAEDKPVKVTNVDTAEGKKIEAHDEKDEDNVAIVNNNELEL